VAAGWWSGRGGAGAGCDMVLVCNDPLAAGELLDSLGRHDNPAALLRLARMHGRHPVNRNDLLADSATVRRFGGGNLA